MNPGRTGSTACLTPAGVSAVNNPPQPRVIYVVCLWNHSRHTPSAFRTAWKRKVAPSKPDIIALPEYRAGETATCGPTILGVLSR